MQEYHLKIKWTPTSSSSMKRAVMRKSNMLFQFTLIWIWWLSVWPNKEKRIAVLSGSLTKGIMLAAIWIQVISKNFKILSAKFWSNLWTMKILRITCNYANNWKASQSTRKKMKKRWKFQVLVGVPWARETRKALTTLFSRKPPKNKTNSFIVQCTTKLLENKEP